MSNVTKIDTTLAPRALGPYSQAVKSDRFIFVSGQLPINPETGIIPQGNIDLHTNQVLKNIEAILHEAGSSFDQVVRCEIFLTDLKKDFSMMNEAYAKFFTSSCPPARQTVQVSALPLDSTIEISCIAIL